ncbi:MAG: response regulator [Thauera sp.]|jgi:DNA-binding NtrC family response regulator|nr:response regulator [Thauera sp.]
MAKILIVDDEVGIRELLSEILRDEGHDVMLAENAATARAVRQAARPDMVLLDIWMPDTDGITLLKEWAANGQLNMPVVMMSGHGTIDTAVEATRIGAIDYLEKPIALQKLLAAVKRGLQRPLAQGTPAPLTLAAFTRSTALRDLRRRVEQISASSRVLLLRVGAGSLAELIARSVHSGRNQWLDLAAVSSPLEISQLQAVQGGVLFVHELTRLNRAQQKNLAFAIDRLERYDLRLVAATESAADRLLADGWDEVLITQLFEVSLAPPSIAEIRDDLPELAGQILLHLAESGEVPLRHFSTAALNQLRNLPWLGGYAELRSAVKSLALGTLEEEIGAADVRRLAPADSAASAAGISLDQPLREAREAFERLYFEHHLRLEAGNMTRLAEKTGLERTHLYRKLKQLGLQAGRRQEEN